MSQEISSNFQVLLKQLCSNGAETKPTWSSVLDTAVSLSDKLSYSFGVDCNQLDQLSIQLWNKTVILKTKVNVDNASITKLRQIAFQMVNAINDSSNDEINLKKQLMMGKKIARSWLDIKELTCAEKVLNTLNQTVQRLQCLVIERGNSGQNTSLANKDKRDVESDMLQIFCLTAELKFSKEEREEAFTIFLKAQDMLSNVPEEVPYLSLLSYNFGVDCFHCAFHVQAVRWLRTSYNLGKEGPNINHKTQARTLRLLANCYMECKEDGWQEKALNAVSLANSEHPHPAGLYISLHLHLMAEEDEEAINKVLKDIADHPDSNLDLILNTLQLLKTFHSVKSAFEVRHEIIHKYQINPKLGLFLTSMMDLLLSEEGNNLVVAKTFADECVSAHVSGQRLDAVTKKQFHILFWNKAAHYFQIQSYEEALSWYMFSLGLYTSVSQSESNVSKLYRNISTCHLNLGNLDRAFEFIERAEHCDPSCPQTHFIAFKIALNTDNADQASSSLQKMVDCVSGNQDIQDANVICLTAYMAMQKNKPELSVPVLECIIKHGGCEDRALTALKCLLRLNISQIENQRTDVKSMLIHLQTAYNKLLVMRDNGSLGTAQLQEEASWFMKIAWNLALQSEKEPAFMKDFFVLCSQLLSLCATDVNNHNKYQTCLVMACAACLQLARKEQDKEGQVNLLEEVLQHLEEYKLADNQAKNSLWAQGPIQTSSSSDVLMLMYEFEALSKLNQPKAEAVLERALTLPKSEPNLFHTLAALASDPPSKNLSLSMRALKVAIRMHLQVENPDFVKCSMDVRSLIELCMKINETEALSYFKETLEMISKRAKTLYPEMELLWLMTKSWNRGLQYFNCNKFTLAEQWCSLSMRLLSHLPSAKADYEEQMTSLYGELMSCLEREGKQAASEE